MNETANHLVEPEVYPGGPQSRLEMMYIEAYLATKGHRFRDLCNLPAEEARRLMIEASRYASAKLAELEAKAQFKKEIHGIT